MRCRSTNYRFLAAKMEGVSASIFARLILRSFAASLFVCMVMPSATLGQQRQLGSGTVMQAVEGLKKGEYLWAPEMSPEGPVLVVVSLATQRMTVYRNGVPIGVSTVSTGKKGYATPTGVFTILQKHVIHKSSLYEDAPMPFMQRLTWKGVALHAGSLPGFPASHGCIRLPLQFAKLLYGVTKLGFTVVITNEAAVPRIAPHRISCRRYQDRQVPLVRSIQSVGTRKRRRPARSPSSSAARTDGSWFFATAWRSGQPTSKSTMMLSVQWLTRCVR